MASLDSWFAALPEKFDAGAAGNLSAVFYFAVTGEGGGDFAVKVADGKCTVEKAKPADPNLTVTMDATDAAAITAGELDPVSAFMAGRLQVEGDISLALRLQDLFFAR